MRSTLSDALLKEVEDAYNRICDLPFPVHASDAQGNFLFANDKARQFFRIAEDASLDGFNIENFYDDASARLPILRKLQASPHGRWVEKLAIRLSEKVEHPTVCFSCMPFFGEDKRLSAMLKIADRMSVMEWFEEFEKSIDTGFFELDKDMKILSCNQHFADILAYPSPEALKGVSMNELMWEPEKLQLPKGELGKMQCEKKQLKMKRKDKAMAIVSINCIRWGSEEVYWTKGTAKDITFDIIHENLPAGLFLITKDSEGDERISRANFKFAEMHGYPSVEAVTSELADVMKASDAVYNAYKAELEKHVQESKAMLDYFMEVKKRDGSKIHVVVNVRALPEEDNMIRVGTVYDLTHNVGKYKRELAANFSALLHTSISTIFSLRNTLKQLVNAFAHNMLRGEREKQLDRQKAQAEIISRSNTLGTLIQKVTTIAKSRDLPESIFDKINLYHQRLSAGPPPEESGDQNENAEIANWSRRNLLELRKHLNELRDYKLHKETTREMRREVENMMRASSMLTLSVAIAELKVRLNDFNYLQKFLLRGDPGTHEFMPQNIVSILSEVIRQLEEFASEEHVSLIRQYKPLEVFNVFCHRSSLNRAINNVVHNAIKYSWSKSRQSEQKAYVEIALSKTDEEVSITVRNWGVPIRKEEIETQSIYEFGRRGRESDDRNRAGTGIGLYDTKEIIEKHQGRISINSEPTLGNSPTDYRHPFITTVTITLPLYEQP